MSKIPVVKKEIYYSLKKTVQEMSRKPDGGMVELGKFWADFKKEQPHLVKIVVREMKGFKTEKLKAAFAHGVWIAYVALKSQEEADEMNEDWGI